MIVWFREGLWRFHVQRGTRFREGPETWINQQHTFDPRDLIPHAFWWGVYGINTFIWIIRYFNCAFGCEWYIYEFVRTILLLNFIVNIYKMYSHPFPVCFVGCVQIDVHIHIMNSHLWVEDCLGAIFLLYFIAFSWLSSALACDTRNVGIIYFWIFCWSFIFIIWWFIILLILQGGYLIFHLRVWNHFYKINELCEVTS